MTLTVSFDDPDEACRWLRHMGKFKTRAARPAPAVPVTAEDHRWQEVWDKFHALGKMSVLSGAYNAREESRRDKAALQQ